MVPRHTPLDPPQQAAVTHGRRRRPVSAPATPVTSTGWIVEGVLRCPPASCGLYFDFCGTPQDLEKFISEHDCATKGQQ